jgi:hypothetical protein
LAWHSTETNGIGLHEFSGWLDKVGSELMLAVNLGTRGTLEALDLLEYANLPFGTAHSEERTGNGRPDPLRDQNVVPGQRNGWPVAIGRAGLAADDVLTLRVGQRDVATGFPDRDLPRPGIVACDEGVRRHRTLRACLSPVARDGGAGAMEHGCQTRSIDTAARVRR